MRPDLAGKHFPQLDDAAARNALVDMHGRTAEALADSPPHDVLRAGVFVHDADRVEAATVLAWRESLTAWARDEFGFPAALGSNERQAEYNVELGKRLTTDLDGVVQRHHPGFWCWVATVLAPHLVLYRWGWPSEKDGDPPRTSKSWRRYNTHLRNGLRLAAYRVGVLGEDVAERCIEQEFQDILERPAFGNDPRVARTILLTLAEAAEEPEESGYGAAIGRTEHCTLVAPRLRIRNVLEPLCFMGEDRIRGITLDVIAETSGGIG